MLADTVLHGLVVMLWNLMISAVTVGAYRGTGIAFLSDCAVQVCLVNASDWSRLDALAFALHHANYGLLANLARVFIALLAANIGFLNFNCTGERCTDVSAGLPSFVGTVRQMPSGLFPDTQLSR